MKSLKRCLSACFIAAAMLMFTVSASAASLSANISAGSYYMTGTFSVSTYVHVYQGSSSAQIIYYLYSTAGDVVGTSEYISGTKYTDVTKNITKYGTSTKLCAYNTNTVSSISLSGHYYANSCGSESGKSHVEKY